MNLSSLDFSHLNVLQVFVPTIIKNMKAMQKSYSGKKIAAVVKANAYGLGAKNLCKVLLDHNLCKDFFVASIEEAHAIKNVVDKRGTIYIFNGILPETEKIIYENKWVPVLINSSQLMVWYNLAKSLGKTLPCILHLDTGMNRSGLHYEDILSLSQHKFGKYLDIRWVLTHLSCNHMFNHPYTQKQISTFLHWCKYFPNTPKSLINSSGLMSVEKKYHFDLARIGFGIIFGIPGLNTTECGFSLHSRIIHIFKARKGSYVGYLAHYHCEQDKILATVAIGHGDGLLQEYHKGGSVYYKGYSCPLIGRLSMDYMTIDISSVPESLRRVGDWVELIGRHKSFYDVAKLSNCSPYALSNYLGNSIRINRVYVDKKNEDKQASVS